ncbi:MAG: outer membrane beta-barrel protein [Bacteroidia bacterium]
MKGYSSILVLLLFSQALLLSQNDSVAKRVKTSTLCFTSNLDVYYHNSAGTKQKAPRTLYADLPGFGLGMVFFGISYEEKRSGLVADITIGPRAGGNAHIINQLFAYYDMTSRIRFIAGQFNSYFGYESFSPVKNFSYSSSYLATYSPSLQNGLMADVDFGRGWKGKVSLTNPNELTEFNPVGTYTSGGQISFLSRTCSFYCNAQYGDQDGRLRNADTSVLRSEGNIFLIDVSAGLDLTRNLFVGFNCAYHEEKPGEMRTDSGIKKNTADPKLYKGAALYLKYNFQKNGAIGLRAEHFREMNGGVGAVGKYNASNGEAQVTAFTFSANLSNQSFRLIPEVRLDIASEDIYTIAGSGGATPQLLTYTLAVVYLLPEFRHLFKEKKQ